MLLPKPTTSYAELADRIQSQRTRYRETMRAWLTRDQTDETYQTLLRLLDDLGVGKAEAIRREELKRLAGQPG